MRIELPGSALVVLVGASGAGKSTFAQRHFLPTEVVSSDHLRAVVAGDESALDANEDAFALLHTIVAMRLKRGLLTVVDATNLRADSRRPLLQLARDHGCAAVAVVLDVPPDVCEQRSSIPPQVVRRHVRALRESLPTLRSEGFDDVVVLRGADAVDDADAHGAEQRGG